MLIGKKSEGGGNARVEGNVKISEIKGKYKRFCKYIGNTGELRDFKKCAVYLRTVLCIVFLAQFHLLCASEALINFCFFP